jgi:hypothetical protein
MFGVLAGLSVTGFGYLTVRMDRAEDRMDQRFDRLEHRFDVLEERYVRHLEAHAGH